MRARRLRRLGCVLAGVVALCLGQGAIAATPAASCEQAGERLKPLRWSDADAAQRLGRPGAGEVRFIATDGAELKLYFHRPRTFDPATGRIWFVAHGVRRDAARYLAHAKAAAEKYGVLALAVEFPRDRYPRGEDYTLGVVTRGRADASAEREHRWRPPEAFLYSELERVFEGVRTAVGSRERGYYLFGHSAGAQFAHRLVTFVPCAHALSTVAANAGWYTFPSTDDPRQQPMPYSLRGTPVSVQQQRALLESPLTILLGTADTARGDEDADLRETSGALAQGPDRLSRGRAYFEAGRELAKRQGLRFGWRLVELPGAGHDASQLIESAAFLLFAADGSQPCDPRDAAAPLPARIRITRHDATQVEVKNDGRDPVCLTGWTLVGDNAGAPVHRFAVGPLLRPGGAMTVDSARLRKADGRLSLRAPTNMGGR